MDLSFIYVFFAIGIVLSISSWVGFGLVGNPFLRVLLRTGFVSFFATPSIGIGHGFVPAPAFLVITLKGHLLIGLVPALAVWLITFVLVISIPRARNNKTVWPLDYASILLNPPHIKVLLYGLVFCLLILGFHEYAAGYWYVGLFLLLIGASINYLICYHSCQRMGRKGFILPLLFTAPVGIAGLFVFAILWCIPGFAGVMVAQGQSEKALWTGAVTSALLFIRALSRTASAIKYQDVPHIKIQGGIPLALSTAIFLFCLTVLFSFLAWRSRAKH